MVAPPERSGNKTQRFENNENSQASLQKQQPRPQVLRSVDATAAATGGFLHPQMGRAHKSMVPTNRPCLYSARIVKKCLCIFCHCDPHPTNLSDAYRTPILVHFRDYFLVDCNCVSLGRPGHRGACGGAQDTRHISPR